MKKITVLIFALAVVVTACATATYHPTKPRSEWGSDHRDCERQVRAIIREDPDIYGDDIGRDFSFHNHTEEQRMIKECMRRKGWRKKP
ncbi:MAG: hypothetical protein LJE94_04425 [Deltaproteobacteria bacterium]|jgi:hypothetical protein|nr:hypothetical protein [Deltaproteobacteria bacterium]